MVAISMFTTLFPADVDANAANSRGAQFVVPKMPQPPVIDGQYSDREWQHAAALTGFGVHGRGRLAYRQSHVWIGYDDRTMYLAVKSPVYPKGRRLVSLRQRRDGGFYGDDAIEVLLDPFGGKHTGSIPYFYFIGNSAGIICHDSREMPGIGQSEMTWNGTWQFANNVDDDWWTAEVSIPLNELDVKNIEHNPTWLIQFSRTYARPVTWTNWPNVGQINNPSGAATAVFSHTSPFLRLLSTEGLMTKLEKPVSGEVVNPGEQPASVGLTIRIRSDTTTLAEEEYTYTLDAGERVPFSFSKPIELPEKAVCEIQLFDRATPNNVLFSHTIPFLKNTPEPAIQAPGEEPDFACRMRHLPSKGELAVWADVFGHPRQKDIATATLTISSEKQGTMTTEKLQPSSGGRVDEHLDVAHLPAGKYKATLRFLDANGDAVDSSSHPFLVRRYDWLGAGIGTTNDVLPPWTPMRVDGNRVTCWNRKYTFNGLGLPRTITSGGPPLLASPIVLKGTADGTPFTVSAENDPTVDEKSASSVTLTGSGAGGGITVRAVSTMEYDGMVKIELDIIPDNPQTKLENLQLIVPVLPEKATLLHALADGIRSGTYAGAMPTGSGVIWNSRDDLFHRSILGSFSPYIWMGDEEGGLCWFASSDEGWVTDDRKPLHEIERTDDAVNLIHHLVARPAQLDAPRKIIFGLQATPVKPMPEGWRGWEFDPVGKRRPGTRRMAWNPFRDYFYRDPTAYVFGIYVDDYDKARQFYQKYVDKLDLDEVFWTTTVNIFASGTPEADAFRDEWFGGSQGQFDARAYDKRQFGEDRNRYYHAGAKLLPSVIDMRLWAAREMLRHGVVDGMYEDNAYPSPQRDTDMGIGYEREDGEWQADFMLFQHRNYRKRMAGVFHELGMEPLIYTHLTSTLVAPIHSFSTIAYGGEWREITDDGSDFMDKWPNDYFRAHILWQNKGLVPLWLPMIHNAKKNVPKHTRTMLAVLQLHDILCDYGHCDAGEMANMWEARASFGISDPEMRFHGYWDDNNPVRVDRADVKTSCWRKPGKTLIILSNFARSNTTLECRVSQTGVETVTDPQNGEMLTFKRDTNHVVITADVPKRDYRFLIVE
ncbi:MAG: DUF6067 family protein [Candidatus Pacebacteria bacterium]|nr:DUF6067 family protein [Candidatus Paceibacterota bacterium]